MMPTLTSMRRPLQTLFAHHFEPALGEAALREVGTGSGMRLTEKEVFEHKNCSTGGLYWKGLLDGNNF
jgi:hypothetical protein